MRTERYRRVILWLVIGIMLAGGPGLGITRAQEESTPDTGDIFYYQAEVLFPAAIRFFVNIDAPVDEITSVSLSIRQESGLSATFAINPTQYLLEKNDTTTRLAYVWMLSDAPLPAPFETLYFMWQVETVNGGRSTAVGSTLFQDNSHEDWQSAGEAPLTLYWYSPNMAGQLIRDETMAAYGLLKHWVPDAPVFRLVIYDSDPLCQTVKDPSTDKPQSVITSTWDHSTYPCSAADFDRLYSNSGIVFLQRPTASFAELENQIVDTMVAATYARLWGDAQVPAWFLSGLASLYRLYPNYPALPFARSAVRTDSLLEPDKLATPLPDDASFEQRNLWESESALLVLYLADRYGAGAPFALAAAIPKQGNNFDLALRALTGSDPSDLWQNWSRWLVSDAADRAISWTPYAETTPTPTVTPTVTPVTPTLPPTATPTITPTATSTFMGDRPPTVIVIEAAPTEPLTPTNTPLPPGSLPTVTPRPKTENTATGGADHFSLLVLVGMLALSGGIVLFVVLIITLRRRK